MTTFLLRGFSSANPDDSDALYSTAAGSMMIQSSSSSSLQRLCKRKSVTFETEFRCVSSDLFLDDAGAKES